MSTLEIDLGYPAIATAAAASRECVSEIAIGMPPATSAARPWSRTCGGSPASISISLGLDYGLLRGEPRREVASRPRPSPRVGELAGGEEAVRQPRAALEGALHSLDLDQVDADGGGHGHLRAT
jgi:hypothetical protein